ncbi:MAG: hypothetical protein GY715_15755 [Planctomycetes bacterium]|nr:hypothetical protein [Planctomycetota bacterium]
MTPRHPVLLILLAAVLVGTGCSDEPPNSDAPTPTIARPVPSPPTVREVAVVKAARPVGALPPGTSCSTAECHVSLSSSRFVHGVLRTGEKCSNCHEADQGDHVYPLKRPGNAGCTHCHAATTGQRIHQHGATEVGCVTCHDPHASDQRSLIRGESVADVCSTCHPAEHPTFPHAPFGNGTCVACHDPHESDFPALLRGGTGTEHCALCHERIVDAIATTEQVHPPARQDCLVCHQPHGSDFPHLLSVATDDACFSCHTDLEQMIAGAEAPHGALNTQASCANCHDAHASSHPSLLKDRQDVLCLQCHDREVLATDGRTIPDMTSSIRDREFLHGPVASGDCSACHNVHGGTHSRLLREQFTSAFYTSFDIKHYALCFECHEADLVTTERTADLTDFRDGDVNLHYLHVNKPKGRTCRTCHEIHGSNKPSHIAETVPFEGSGWALPIGFRKTDTGGSCAPGCHKPMDYDRVAPIASSAPKEPAATQEEATP